MCEHLPSFIVIPSQLPVPRTDARVFPLFFDWLGDRLGYLLLKCDSKCLIAHQAFCLSRYIMSAHFGRNMMRSLETLAPNADMETR